MAAKPNIWLLFPETVGGIIRGRLLECSGTGTREKFEKLANRKDCWKGAQTRLQVFGMQNLCEAAYPAIIKYPGFDCCPKPVWRDERKQSNSVVQVAPGKVWWSQLSGAFHAWIRTRHAPSCFEEKAVPGVCQQK